MILLFIFILNKKIGNNLNQLNYPRGIRINKNNEDLFICDNGNSRILIINSLNNEYKFKIGIIYFFVFLV